MRVPLTRNVEVVLLVISLGIIGVVWIITFVKPDGVLLLYSLPMHLLSYHLLSILVIDWALLHFDLDVVLLAEGMEPCKLNTVNDIFVSNEELRIGILTHLSKHMGDNLKSIFLGLLIFPA